MRAEGGSSHRVVDDRESAKGDYSAGDVADGDDFLGDPPAAIGALAASKVNQRKPKQLGFRSVLATAKRDLVGRHRDTGRMPALRTGERFVANRPTPFRAWN